MVIVKDFVDIVEDILDRIIADDIGFDDKSKGSTLRTIVEAIVSELDVQYYQLQYLYDMMSIDTATGDDLDRLITILNVYRNQPTQCVGIVSFKRENPATYDILIPSDTLISTRNINNVIYEFVTIEGKVLQTGQTSVDVKAMAVIPGLISISPTMLSVMNNPILGIDSVINESLILGGTDIEADDTLRYRAKLALSALGKATMSALEGILLDIDDIDGVKVLDMSRGVGTADIIITPKSIPPSQELMDEISIAIANTKAVGIHVLPIYPTIETLDVSITLLDITSGIDMVDARNGAGKAILSYMASLKVGSPFIIKQLEASVISLTGFINDMTTVLPIANTSPTVSTIIRIGTITIDGSVWIDE